jgi:protein tyrosine phosphatase (PTP) superfamily phosphohydrolase (DUF442 family)
MHTCFNHRRRIFLAIAAGACLPACQFAQAAETRIQAPNVVQISTQLFTSGQPNLETLSNLSQQGFEALIYLAPPTSSDAVPGEADIIQSQGMEFVNIPIQFGNPTQADFDAFVDAMNRFRNRKLLVHCQVNMRASSMTFLYRVIIGHEKPELAYESVARIWSPSGAWKKLITDQLKKANITFEPY